MINNNSSIPIWRTLLALACGALISIAGQAAEPVASSSVAVTEPTVVDFGKLSEDATYVFFFNAVKAGASTAVAGNAAWGLKLDQWNEQGLFGTTEFGVVDNVFEPDGPGDPSSIFEEDTHVAFVNDFGSGEVRLYVNGVLSGFHSGNFELSGEAKVMAARIDVDTDPMAEGSIMYSWATYDSLLTDAEIAELAAAAEPTEPAEPADPGETPEPEDPSVVIASSTYAPITPAIVDFGKLSGDASYEFFFKAVKGGASTAIAGNAAIGIKLDQWNEQGVFGLTEFGVADHIFAPAGAGTPESVFDQDVHVVIVNDATNGESRLYIDGIYSGVLASNFELTGEGKVMAARIDEDTDPMGDGSIIYSWATYDGALPEEKIAELAAAATPFDPSGPFTEPTVVDFGLIEGDASYEFFFNAVKDGASTAVTGNAAWGLKLDQWNEQGVFGLTEFGVVDSVFEIEGNGSDHSVFGEDAHVVFVNDVTNGENRLYVNGVYVGFIEGNYALSGPAKVMAARIDANTDPMGDGSILYYWAVHRSVLTEEEIGTLAAGAETREPSEPNEPVDTPEPNDPVFPEGAITEPTVVDFGDVPGDASYEFFFNAIKAGASTAIAGNDVWGIKLDQWNEQGVFGLTEFGVVDSIFQQDGTGSEASVFGEDVHVIFVNDITGGEVRLYVDGLYSGFIEGNFELSGEGKVMAARIEQDTDPMGDGSVLYSWAVHQSILTNDEIAALANGAEPQEPSEPAEPTEPNQPPLADGTLIAPTVVDFGSITGDATYEFFFNAVKAGTSTAVAGNDAWGLKLDQWNEQGVFGLTEFGVADHIFQADGPGSEASVFGEDVHVVFVNDVTGGQVRLYVNGLYSGFIEDNFELSGEGKVMAARIEQDTDPMGEGSAMYRWTVFPGVVSDAGIAALAAGGGTPTLPPIPGGQPGSITGINRSADGSISIEYTGNLEAAPTLDGTYSAVAGASSPYSVNPVGGSTFYIAR
jgi:hypothetical protein